MAGTRATEKRAAPEPDTKVADPTPQLEANRPKTKEDLESWMQDASRLLLEYLNFCRRQACEQPVASRIKEIDQELDTAWRTTWAPQTDVQTGEIYDEGARDAMFAAMQPLTDERSGLQHENNNNEWHRRYAVAQNNWDDFLYYQNEWNRRVSRKSTSFHDEWSEFLVKLFHDFAVGARNNVPELLGPAELHQYPECTRNRSSRPTPGRRQHLLERFPRSTVRLDHDQIERRRTEVNKGRRALEHFDAARLPDRLSNVRPYSAAAARGWRDHDGNKPPTSWESEQLGPVISARRIPSIVPPDDRPRYETREVESLVRAFLCKTIGKDLKPVTQGSGNKKQYLGHYVNRVRLQRHFVLDANGQRIEEPQRSTKVQKLTNDRAKDSPRQLQGPGRRDRARLRVERGESKDWHLDRATGSDREVEFSDDQDTDDDRPQSEDGQQPLIDIPEDDSEDENDLFALTYRMPIPPKRNAEGPSPGRPSPDGPSPDDPPPDGNHSGKDSDDSDDDRPDGKQAGRNKKGKKPMKPTAASKSAKKPSSTEKANRVSKHEPNPKAPGETFEAVPGDDRYDLAAYTHTFPDGTTFTQRTLVPAFLDDVAIEKGKDSPRKVFPKEFCIPTVPDSTNWKRNPRYTPQEDNKFQAVNGRWDNGRVQWVPTIILRSFRLDNNAYYNCSINPNFSSVLKTGKSGKQVLDVKYSGPYNKAFQQFYRRNDSDHKARLEAADLGPWTAEELKVVRDYTRGIFSSDGLIEWVDKWSLVHAKALLGEINAHRLKDGKTKEGRKARSADSVKSKVKRFLADQFDEARKLKEEVASGKVVSEDRLKPEDVFKGHANEAEEEEAEEEEAEGAESAGTIPTGTVGAASSSTTNPLQPSDRTAKRKRAATEPAPQTDRDGEDVSEDRDDVGTGATRASRAKRARRAK